MSVVDAHRATRFRSRCMSHTAVSCPIERVTAPPFHHFFGYYEKTPWSGDGRYLLGHRVAFMQRPPTAEDVAVIGLIDRADGNRWRTVGESVAWCWQQSTMLQWLGGPGNRNHIIFNSRTQDGFEATILDVTDGSRRRLSPTRLCRRSPGSLCTLSQLRPSRPHPSGLWLQGRGQ